MASNAKWESAMVAALDEMRDPPCNSNNPHLKSKYANLAAVRDTVIPVLRKHGFSVSQLPVVERFDGGVVFAGVNTVVRHVESGESVTFPLMLPTEKANAQGVGSALTYARRYSLLVLCGVVGDPDDDGNDASTPPPKPQRSAQAKPDAQSPGQTLLAAVKGWSGVDDADLGSVARQVMDKAGVVVPKGSKVDGTGVTKCEMWMNKNTFEELNK